MIHASEEILAHKRKAGSTTYMLNIAEIEALMKVSRRAEALLHAKPYETESKHLDLAAALREIGAI